MRGKRSKLAEGERDKLGEPYKKVRLGQDRLPIEPFPCIKSQVRGEKE